MTDVAKLIGKAFELGATFVDGHATLMMAVLLGLEVDDALDLDLNWIYHMANANPSPTLLISSL